MYTLCVEWQPVCISKNFHSRTHWKILHLTEIFYTTSGCDGCDKYQVWHLGTLSKHFYEIIWDFFGHVWGMSGASSGACLGHVWGIIWGMSGASSGACMGHVWGINCGMSGACLGHHLGNVWGIIWGMSGACLGHHLCHVWGIICGMSGVSSGASSGAS